MTRESGLTRYVLDTYSSFDCVACSFFQAFFQILWMNAWSSGLTIEWNGG